MDRIPAARESSLTCSFRFDRNIAELANCLLQAKKDPLRLSGASPWSGFIAPIEEFPYTILTRTNAGQIEEAIELMAEHPTMRIQTIGDFQRALDKLVSVYWLSKGEKVIHADIKPYVSIQVLRDEMILQQDAELRNLFKLLERYESEIPELVDILQEHAAPDAEGADVVFSTIHKAKGLEWDRVKLGEDLEETVLKKDTLEDHKDETLNILYVAITRCTQSPSGLKPAPDHAAHRKATRSTSARTQCIAAAPGRTQAQEERQTIGRNRALMDSSRAHHFMLFKEPHPLSIEWTDL
jgi:F-box protein 18 (helicase)